jgi:integrase/recombinase XerD
MKTPPAFTSALAPVLTRYLALQTVLGRGYGTERQFFHSLDGFLTAAGAPELTPVVFDQWCQTQAHLKSGIRRAQMRIVRNLCLYRRRTEPDCFVPDLASFPPVHQYAPPYLMSQDEIARLLATASTLESTPAYPLRAHAIRVALILLATAGLRRGELVRLTVGDYDPQERTLLIRVSKFHKSRLLPLSHEAAVALEGYLTARRAYQPATATAAAPLIWWGGARLRHYTGTGFARVFRIVACRAGVRTPAGQPPRVHDLRHSFAVQALLRWYHAGVDVQAKLPFLSTYMGHVSIASTQYYLRFVDPLARAASERFAQHYGALLTPQPTEEPR